MANLTTYLISAYELSGGSTNWLSINLSEYSTYQVELIWSNVTGTLDGSLLVRETDDNLVFKSLETEILNTEDETRVVFTKLNKKKLSVKFTVNGVTGGRLSIRITAFENKLQAHNTDKDSHCDIIRRFT